MIVKIRIIDQLRDENNIFETVISNVEKVNFKDVDNVGQIEAFSERMRIYDKNLEPHEEVKITYYADNGRRL